MTAEQLSMNLDIAWCHTHLELRCPEEQPFAFDLVEGKRGRMDHLSENKITFYVAIVKIQATYVESRNQAFLSCLMLEVCSSRRKPLHRFGFTGFYQKADL